MCEIKGFKYPLINLQPILLVFDITTMYVHTYYSNWFSQTYTILLMLLLEPILVRLQEKNIGPGRKNHGGSICLQPANESQQ